jgi:hypothetical protein
MSDLLAQNLHGIGLERKDNFFRAPDPTPVPAAAHRVSRPPEIHQCGPPPAGFRRGVPEFGNQWMPFEQGANPAPQGPGSLAVYDFEGKNTSLDAFGDIVLQQVGDLGRPKGVQVQAVFNGQLNRFQPVCLLYTDGFALEGRLQRGPG